MIFILVVREQFDGGYDSYDSKIVCAPNESEARRLANELPGDEGAIWEDPVKVTCEELTPDGKPGVILASFNAG